MDTTRKAILIDGDMLAMRALTSCEVEIEFEPLLWTRYAELDKALEQYRVFTEALTGRWPGYDPIHFFSSGCTFRHRLLSTYKAHRRPKPIGYAAFVHELSHGRASLPYVVSWPNVETDDMMSLYASASNCECVIASGDKDLDQVPGHHQWLDKYHHVTPQDALRNLYIQCVLGDSTDGVPGLKGYGKVRATNAVDAILEMAPHDPAEQRRLLYSLWPPDGHPARDIALVQLLVDGQYDFDRGIPCQQIRNLCKHYESSRSQAVPG